MPGVASAGVDVRGHNGPPPIACREELKLFLRQIRYLLRRPPRRQTCKDCWRSDALDFYVPDPVWDAVARGCTVLCLACFDRRAEDAGIDYRSWLTVLGRGSWLVRFDS